MEKREFLPKRAEITWHPKRAFPFKQSPFAFHQAHPDLKAPEQRRRERETKTIHIVHENLSVERMNRLIAGEGITIEKHQAHDPHDR